ncbi:hypothetical protein [Streptomyces sp. NPDC046371]|uniref:hypothetical protein n=1 Tax=unclassified Streptomyces TaxID=2593676 RepID=UPI0033CD2F1B
MQKVPRAVAASLVLAILGIVTGAVYAVERLSSGGRPDAFLESSAAMLLGAWLVMLFHFVRTRGSRP